MQNYEAAKIPCVDFFPEPQALGPLLPHSVEEAAASWFLAATLGLDKALTFGLGTLVMDFQAFKL